MCTRPITVRLPPNPYEYSQGMRSDKYVQVPCGKCPECLSKRQLDISVRAYREAVKYGNCHFVTLTYKPSCVPFAQTLLDIDEVTGEVIKYNIPELCSSEVVDSVRNEYRDADKGVFYKYVSICRFEGHEYQVVYTPTLYYTDVRLVIKNFRVKYERTFKEHLKFSYICVGEYGRKNSCRPHYHLLFFGLTKFQVDFFTSMWSYGRFYTESVKFKNDDGSDGLAKVAGYIGKYAAKGSFNPSSVVNHLTLPCRVASSRGLGLSDIDCLVSYYRGYDIVGKYDIERLDFDYDKQKLYDILFNRLTYNFNGKSIRLGVSLTRKIFNFRLVQGKGCWSRLYYEIMDLARSRYQDLLEQEFKEFCSSKPNAKISDLVFEYEMVQKSALRFREENQKSRFAKFYSSSKF